MSSSSPWKHIGIAVLTLLAVSGSAVVLWALYGNALVPPERLLPAETAILMSDTDPATLRIVQAWIPALKTLPERARDTTTAVIASGGSLRMLTLVPGMSLSANPYRILGNENAALAHPAHTLEDTATYEALLPSRHAGDPWIFVNPAYLPQGKTAVMPRPWLHFSGALALSLTDSSISISTLDDGPATLPTFATQLPQSFVHPLLSLQTTDLPSVLGMLATHADNTITLTAESLGTQWLHDALGTDLSVPYDILPLLKGKTSVEFGRMSATGKRTFLIAGELPDTDTTHLDLIASAFTSALPSAHRQTLLFDKGFSSDTLSANDAAIDHLSMSVDGWKVVTIKEKETGQSLTLAQHGSDFLLSDASGAVLNHIKNTLPSVPLAHLNGTLLASGLFDRSASGSILSDILGPAFAQGLSLPPTMGPTVVWTVTREHKRITLHLETLPAETGSGTVAR